MNTRQLEAARFGLITALLAMAVATVGMELTWRSMSSETQGFIQQSIGDTATLAAGHVTAELDHLMTGLRADSLQLARTGSVNTSADDSDFVVFSLWKKEPGAAHPVRSLSWVNPTIKLRFQDVDSRLKSLEMTDNSWMDSVFNGQVSVRGASSTLDPKGLLWIAIPPTPGSNESISAWVFLSRFQKVFLKDRMVQAMLVDATGTVLGHPDGKTGSPDSLPEIAIVKWLNQPANSALPSTQMRFEDSENRAYYGGARRLGVGGLSIVASVSEQEARSGLQTLKIQAVAFVLLTLVVTFVIGFFYSNRRAVRDRQMRKSDPGHLGQADSGLVETSEPSYRRSEPRFQSPLSPNHPPAERGPRTIVFGTIRVLPQLMDGLPESVLADSISDVMTLVASRVRDSGGSFELHSGSSFNAVWEKGSSAIHFALELRKDLQQLNASRKTDGLRELKLGLGIHSDSAVTAFVGPAGRRRDVLIGEIHACARALERIAESSGVDFLITHSLRDQLEGHWNSKPLGEAKLTAHSGLTEYYWVEDATITQLAKPATAEGQAVSDTPPGELIKRWLVNNGTQMVGPLDAPAIAAQLFAQELDFDSECWTEGSGESSRIESAGIFTGTQEEAASLWAYDGKTVHGPLTQAFLMTALVRGALPSTSFICEKSTVTGWTPAALWKISVEKQVSIPKPAAA